FESTALMGWGLPRYRFETERNRPVRPSSYGKEAKRASPLSAIRAGAEGEQPRDRGARRLRAAGARSPVSRLHELMQRTAAESRIYRSRRTPHAVAPEGADGRASSWKVAKENSSGPFAAVAFLVYWPERRPGALSPRRIEQPQPAFSTQRIAIVCVILL